jgi:hypothetical protein
MGKYDFDYMLALWSQLALVAGLKKEGRYGKVLTNNNVDFVRILWAPW